MSQFLVDLSDLLVDAGPRGFRLAGASLAPPFKSELTYTALRGAEEPASALFPLALRTGQAFTSHAQRRTMFWQPAATAPAYLQTAWLVSELHNELTYFTEQSLALVSLGGADPRHLDVALSRDGNPVTVRIQIEARTAPLDFPATAIREHLTDHPVSAAPHSTVALTI